MFKRQQQLGGAEPDPEQLGQIIIKDLMLVSQAVVSAKPVVDKVLRNRLGSAIKQFVVREDALPGSGLRSAALAILSLPSDPVDKLSDTDTQLYTFIADLCEDSAKILLKLKFARIRKAINSEQLLKPDKFLNLCLPSRNSIIGLAEASFGRHKDQRSAEETNWISQSLAQIIATANRPEVPWQAWEVYEERLVRVLEVVSHINPNDPLVGSQLDAILGKSNNDKLTVAACELARHYPPAGRIDIAKRGIRCIAIRTQKDGAGDAVVRLLSLLEDAYAEVAGVVPQGNTHRKVEPAGQHANAPGQPPSRKPLLVIGGAALLVSIIGLYVALINCTKISIHTSVSTALSDPACGAPRVKVEGFPWWIDVTATLRTELDMSGNECMHFHLKREEGSELVSFSDESWRCVKAATNEARRSGEIEYQVLLFGLLPLKSQVDPLEDSDSRDKRDRSKVGAETKQGKT
jgi:hypothetical protein